MKSVGIIAEFNPLHNGHKLIIDEAHRNGDVLIAVMSSNYVQRGEPALFSKYSRAKAALKSGCDLIIELPSPWSASCAANYAFGGISLLKSCNTEKIIFGTESGDAQKLVKIADFDLSNKLDLSGNNTFAHTRENNIKSSLGIEFSQILKNPNDNLAIEYIKAIALQNAEIECIGFKRVGTEHNSNDTNGNICSASYIRENFKEIENVKEYMPKHTFDILQNDLNECAYTDYSKYSQSVISYLRRFNADDFKTLPDISEGIENKLYKELRTASNINDLYEKIKSKRYTLARIRRLILSAFLEFNTEYFLKPVPYMNILGFTEKGEKYLKDVISQSDKPIIISGKNNKPLDKSTDKLFNKECKRNDIYYSFYKNPKPCGNDYTFGIIKERI